MGRAVAILRTHPQESPEIIDSYSETLSFSSAIDLTVSVYELTADFPKSERYGLLSPMRRAAVSIASNIAEGGGEEMAREN